MARASKRPEILQSGLDLVHRGGLGATGVAAIAEAAHAPKGSFYNHFKSKDDFARAILLNYFEDAQAALNDEFSRAGRSGFEKLKFYFTRLRNYNSRIGFNRGCLIGNISAEASQLSDETRTQLDKLLRQWTGLLASAVEEGQRDGSITIATSHVVAAGLLLDAWQGALLRGKVQQSAASQDHFINVLLPQVLRGGVSDAP